MLIQLTPLQARVIGVLIEKEITTPEQYPLSLNAITLGCNQKSSREPILNLQESQVQNVLDELRAKNLLFEHQSTSSRVLKYKHRFCNTEFSSLQFTPQALGIICVLLLRGPQTPGELRTRTNRLAEFASVNEVESVLVALGDVNGEKLVVKLSKEPGKRESRFAHLFCGNKFDAYDDAKKSADELDPLPTPEVSASTASQELQQAITRIYALEEQVSLLTKRIADMEESIEILSN